MEVIETKLKDLIIIKPKVFNDQRGYFFELNQKKRYQSIGLPEFVQTNISRSSKNALRGLHFQKPNAQGKLVGVTSGKVLDISVDIRKNSPTFAQWFAVELSDENHWQVYIPPGFAHGFCVLSDIADFYYQCSDYYAVESEHGIAWNDPDINIDWQCKNPILSEKDKHYKPLKEIDHEHLF